MAEFQIQAEIYLLSATFAAVFQLAAFPELKTSLQFAIGSQLQTENCKLQQIIYLITTQWPDS